jgi:hypothetical protein
MPENLTSSIGPEQQFKNYLDEGKFMIQKSKCLDKFFFSPKGSFSWNRRERFRMG